MRAVWMMLLVVVVGGCASRPGRLTDEQIGLADYQTVYDQYVAHATWNQNVGAGSGQEAYTEKLRLEAISRRLDSPEEKRHLRDRMIWKGMSDAQLMLSWGPPLKTTQHNTPTMAVTIWDYAPYSYRMTREVWVSSWKVVWWTQSEH